jgi:hypothetical protein
MEMLKDRVRIRIIVPVWGTDYVHRWLQLSFASMLADGNLPYLKEHSDVELIILTKAADAAVMTNDGRFKEAMAGIRTSCITIDEFFPPERVSYGVPLTLAYGKAIAKIGDKDLGSFAVLLNADFILSKGSLANLLRRIEAGHTVVTAPSIRVPDHIVRPILLTRLDADGKMLSMSGREMMKLVNRYPHSSVLGRTINENNLVDSSHYHLIYWRVSQDFLMARYFLLMPLCFQVQTRLKTVICPVDYGFISEACPNATLSVLNDSDDFVMLELQEQHAEAALLRIAPSTDSLEQRLQLFSTQLAKNATEWTTAEHRRSAGYDLYFHSEDIPSDVRERTKIFTELIDGVLATLPPPVSHIGHFHWHGALHFYRMAWIDRGSPSILDDPRNLPPVLLANELTDEPAASGRTSNRLAEFLESVGSAFEAVSILYLGVEVEVPLPPGRFRRFKVAVEDARSADMALDIRIPEEGFPDPGGALVLLGTTDDIAHWPKYRRLSQQAFCHGTDVFVVFFTPTMTPVILADYSWILSRILYDFTSDEHETTLKTIDTPMLSTMTPVETAGERFLRRIRTVPRHPIRSGKRLVAVIDQTITQIVQNRSKRTHNTASAAEANVSLVSTETAESEPSIQKVAGIIIHMRPHPRAGHKNGCVSSQKTHTSPRQEG